MRSPLLTFCASLVVAGLLVVLSFHQQDSTVVLKQTQSYRVHESLEDSDESVEERQFQLQRLLRRIIKAVAPHDKALLAAFPGAPKPERQSFSPNTNSQTLHHTAFVSSRVPKSQKLQAAFPGLPKEKTRVCEPWPSCCDGGEGTTKCFGVSSSCPHERSA